MSSCWLCLVGYVFLLAMSSCWLSSCWLYLVGYILHVCVCVGGGGQGGSSILVGTVWKDKLGLPVGYVILLAVLLVMPFCWPCLVAYVFFFYHVLLVKSSCWPCLVGYVFLLAMSCWLGLPVGHVLLVRSSSGSGTHPNHWRRIPWQGSRMAHQSGLCECWTLHHSGWNSGYLPRLMTADIDRSGSSISLKSA